MASMNSGLAVDACAPTFRSSVCAWFGRKVTVLFCLAMAGAQATVPLSGVTAIGTGIMHSCAITAGGGVRCWGDNHQGQLGDGTTTERPTAVEVSGLAAGAVAIAAGAYHTCALTSEGGVKCWGNNGNGQLGDGTTSRRVTPVDVIGMTSGVVAIAAGGFHTCALTSGSGVKCWGNNGNGQLGDGTTTQRTSAVDVSGLTAGIARISAGTSHTCAVTGSGGAKCWGNNGNGQLGDGTTTQRTSAVDVSGFAAGIAAIAAGGSHTCALTATGGAKCWGNNDHGEIGDGTTNDRWTATDVSGLASGAVAIVAGSSHSCAIDNAGAVRCWGSNAFGQIGDGTMTQRTTPTDVSGLASGVTALAAGYAHTCASSDTGGMRCWGWNDYGQVGDGTTTRRWTAVDVSGLASGIIAVAAGGSHNCSLRAIGGAVECWGRNDFGQLGDGTTHPTLAPVQVGSLGGGNRTLALGVNHTCALTAGQGVKCWGANGDGQLGDGTTTDRLTPVDVSGLTSGVLAIAAGSYHSCALTSGYGLKCWGSNGNGQLGDGTWTDRPTPVDVTGMASDVVAIAAGNQHTCAMTTANGVKCWGWNGNGQLGDGTQNPQPTPVDVVGLTSGVDTIAAGNQHSCALILGGGAKCWGANTFAQLGDGTTTRRLTAVDVSGLTSGVSDIAAGSAGYFTCAVTTGGGAKCWGNNGYGQLGDGTVVQRANAVDVAGLASGVGAVAAGQNHSCALTSAGGVKCWGDNRYGQVGDGTSGLRAVPVVVVVAGGSPPTLIGVASRKLHGSAGTFDLPLGLTPSSPTTEPRSGGAGGNHTIVFAFDSPVTSGTAAVTAGTGTAGAPNFGGNEMSVPLTGVANQQYVTVSVSDVNGSTGVTGSVRIGFLLGDVSQNRVVTVSDLGQVNAQIAQVVTASNYLKDVNATGTLTVADKGIANTQITKALPAP